MKTDKVGILKVALAMCILSDAAVGSPAALSSEQASLGAVESITVETGCCQQAKEAGFSEQDIRRNIHKQLENAGIEVMPQAALASLPGRCRFRATVTIYKSADPEMLVYCLKVEFVQTVALERRPETKVDAITWQRTWLASGTRKRLAEAIPHNLKVLTTSFIRDYRRANPKGDKPARAGGANKGSAGQIQSNGRSVPSEHRCIGSKSSDVFHKPDCRWAQNISAENLVSYGTRDEAIKAAKRPCKSCNP